MTRGRLRYRSANRLEEFSRAAETIADRIRTIEGVVGILGTGGIGGGYCDDFSDLDVITYVEQATVEEIREYVAVGFMRFKGISLDTPVESYDEALAQLSPSPYWSQVMRWDRQNSVILFQRGEMMTRLLEAKLVFPEDERESLLEEHQQGVEEHLCYNFWMWRGRGGMVNLADAILRATEHLVLWTYAKNKVFQPYLPKWLFYYMENGLIPESRHFEVIRSVYRGDMGDLERIERRRDRLVALCNEVGMNLSETDLEELHRREEENYQRSSARTRHYLSW